MARNRHAADAEPGVAAGGCAGRRDDPRTAELLLSLAGEHSIMVVEHAMSFVRSIARRVVVLHEGQVIAEGDMDKVQKDPRVIEVYLGV